MPTFCDPWPGNRNASFPIARFSTGHGRGVKQVVTIGQIGPKLRLKITAGNAVGTEVTVDDELLIGREVPGEGKLEGDIELSRRHARIARRGEGEWEIEDLDSRNGTFVNGSRLERPALLAAGDAIEVGTTKLVVQVSAPTKPSEVSPAPPSEAPPSASAGSVADGGRRGDAEAAARRAPARHRRRDGRGLHRARRRIGPGQARVRGRRVAAAARSLMGAQQAR